ncbi:hypothetical protein ACOJD9_003144 [Cronobacter dublinensis]
MLQFNFRHFEFLTMHTGQWEKILSLVNSNDDIGVFLRVHLLIEQSLEAWCICASENNNFFNGFGENLNIDFATKAQLSQNFGLSEPVFKFVKRVNRLRNIRAHQIEKFNITDAEIDALTSLMEVDYPSDIVPMEKFSLSVFGDRDVGFKNKETSNRDRLIMLFGMFLIRINGEARVCAQNCGYKLSYQGHSQS